MYSDFKKYKHILFTFGLWLFFGLIIFVIGIINTYALTYTNVGSVNSNTDIIVEVTYQTESGLPNVTIPFDTTVQTQFKTMLITVSNYNFIANRQYQLEIHLPNMQLTNANTYVVSDGTGNCKISYDNSIFQNEWPRWNFECPNNTNSIGIRVYNNNGSAITNMGSFKWNGAYLRYTDESIPDQNNNAIIENNNQNTQNIIDNQNQNTQNIIDNQNQNTQNLIDSNKVCRNITKDDGIVNGFLNASGSFTSHNNYTLTDYLQLTDDDIIVITDNNNNAGNASLCFYNEEKIKISCISSSTLTINQEISIPDNSKYARFSINKINNVPNFKVCQNGNQANYDALEKNNQKLDVLNKNLTDTNVDTSALNDAVGWLPPGPVDSIINLPLSMFSSLLNALGKTCTPLSVPLPYVNENLEIPCLTSIFNRITGVNSFWSWVGGICSVLILYNYLLSLYHWVDDTLSLRENTMPGYYDDHFGGGA